MFPSESSLPIGNAAVLVPIRINLGSVVCVEAKVEGKVQKIKPARIATTPNLILFTLLLESNIFYFKIYKIFNYYTKFSVYILCLM
jgi:hypothetical protein